MFNDIFYGSNTDIMQILVKTIGYDTIYKLHGRMKTMDLAPDSKEFKLQTYLKSEIKKRKSQVSKLHFSRRSNREWRDRIELLRYCLKKFRLLLDTWSQNTRLEFPSFKLHKIQLQGADLRGMNFSEVDLAGANFSGANLTGTRFENCDLTNAIFKKANLTGTSMRQAFLKGANLKSADLSNADLEEIYLADANLKRANLSGVSMMNSGHLETANLTGANFSGANLSFNWTETVWDEELEDYVERTPGVNLSGMDLQGMNFSNANLMRANLSGANLARVDFSGANLIKVDFTGANLTGCDLSNSDLTSAKLDRVDLSHSNLRNAVFESSQINVNHFPAMENFNTALFDRDMVECSDKTKKCKKSRK